MDGTKSPIHKGREVLNMTASQHYTKDREKREAIIKMIGKGHIIKVAVIDHGHRNGPEIHKVSDTGIISIYNLNSGKLITRLIARPGQLQRYFDGDTPVALLAIARHHKSMGYNNK